MDIKEIKQKKAEFEKKLLEMIVEFVGSTGADIKEIRVNMIPERSVGGNRGFIFGGVDVIIEV